MNRRQKIIISVTGIFIVMLILVGLTYAYFLTQITGNTKEKSISVTTANLVVKYEDGTNIILDENTKLIPSSNAIGTKTFDVVNEGDENDYVVIVDNISIKNATTGETTTFKTNDFVYTLECTSSDGTDCSDVNTKTTLPLKNQSILIGNRITTGVTHTYTLRLWYLDNGSDQSDDMNKTLSVRVNIEDIRRLDNPYKDNTNSLAYNIINNSINATNDTQLMGYPSTKVAEEINEASEKVLSVTTDDYGTSYYYRGSVKDNYVNFARKCWRIVRIDGNGNIKLILEDKEAECDSTSYTGISSIGNGHFGYTQYAPGTLTASDGETTNINDVYLMDYLHGKTETDASMATAFKIFQGTFTEEALEYMKSGDWCLNDLAYADTNGTQLLSETQKLDSILNKETIIYDSFLRLNGSSPSPTLKCNGTVMSSFEDSETNPTPMYVGGITVDEVTYAGGEDTIENLNFYLLEDEDEYMTPGFMTLSPTLQDYSNFIYNVNLLAGIDSGWGNIGDFRPAIMLKSNVEIISGGNGTKDKPYEIKIN